MESVFSMLRSHVRLERDTGIAELSKLLSSDQWKNKESVESLKSGVLALVDDSGHWESRQGGLQALCVILRGSDGWWIACGVDFGETVRNKALELLIDDEARVRIQAGEALGLLCQRNGCIVYEKSRESILRVIKDNLERVVDHDTQQSSHTKILVDKLAPIEITVSQGESSMGQLDISQIFHDTAGWKGLDTGMRCLCCVVDGCGTDFDTFIDNDFLQLIFSTLSHTNRFVRESAYQLLTSLVKGNASNGSARPSVVKYSSDLSVALGKGLADNWSQVRLAASIATREFLLSLTGEERAKQFPELLPKMCLNRYYVAEGVRLYSQESWRLITHDRGKQLVEKHISETAVTPGGICGVLISQVDYYIEQTVSDNHAVREAACACIAELGSKIDASVVEPHVLRLLPALVSCFRDESWPVRDAACIACGNFVKCFADHCRPVMTELYPLFFSNLSDSIPSVRQGAAMALTNVVKTYGGKDLDFVLGKAAEGILKVKEQKESSTNHGDLDSSLAIFGVVKRARDNDMELHSDQQMYSCGSLAPKLKRGAGCMHSNYKKVSEPWEIADGCIDLLGELSQLPDASQQIAELLPSIADATNSQHYAHHFAFLETVWKQLPRIAKGIGKRMFKRNIELYFPSLFYSLDCGVPLTSSAATDCFFALRDFVGEAILRGRVEQFNPSLVPKLNSALS